MLDKVTLVHELVEAQVQRTPHRTALRAGAASLSYVELDARADRLARELHRRGVGRGQRIGVCVERDADMLAVILGVLKAGAAYVPLDPSFPRERLTFMAQDARLALLVTTSTRAGLFGLPRERQLLLDADAGSLDEAQATKLRAGDRASTADPAYTIYTSGSTGKPKGVVIPHGAVVNLLVSMAREPGLTEDDVLVAVTTLSFDIAVLELLLPLAVGATVVIASRDEAMDGRALRTLLEQHRATVMQATPVTWRILLDAGWQGAASFKALVGGEALPEDLAGQLLARGVELWNMYGPTETTVWSTCCRVTDARDIHIGRPIGNTEVHILDPQGQPVPPGCAGELLIGGAGLACGYFDRPELTTQRFIAHPARPGARLYRTGDLARSRLDGNIDCLGRLDEQVKVRGLRIELGEIEVALGRIEGIRQAVVALREDSPGDKRLVAYYTSTAGEALTADALRQRLGQALPDYMVPSVFQRVEGLPLTPNGKVDRKALPAPLPSRPRLTRAYIAPRTAIERRLAALWRELLQVDEIGIDDSFFDLGGTSLLALRLVSLYRARFATEIPLVKVFQHPTIARFGRFLAGAETESSFHEDAERRAALRRSAAEASTRHREAVAIIGMVGRFPGAQNIEELWRNLCDDVESISFFAPEELGPGIEARLRDDPDYVRARGFIEGAELFDAAFFGIGPLEARVMDPQQRVFLELAHHALENAGYDPERYRGLIGVFAGIGDNHYYTTNLLTHPDLMAMAGKLAVEYGNQKDYIALRTAYLLDLRGPAVSLNTACSTTLLAADQAYRALLDFECDIALAGGVDITVPQKSGFLHQAGGTFARDGHCRPFDADATGTMFCDGAGIVVLKRLRDALADGDTVYAVVLGSGRNNSGARPASFLAPCVESQAEAIAMAQARAGVPVETIRYIEAHGTGTPLGDPIEMEALRQVFESKTDKKQFCHVGSIKGHIGHPTNAAGIAGLIKAAMVLHREQIPSTLHFKKPNPKIDFSNSPFLVADRLTPFPRTDEPRRAAVSAFGFGGTNVHMILEEAELARPSGASRPMQLLPLSARSPAALDACSRALAEHFERAPGDSLADAAHTLQSGRRQMAQRRFIVAADAREAAMLLRKPNALRCGSRRCERRDPPVVFMFGGQGTQYVNMGLDLYLGEPLFRAVVDECCELLKPLLGRDLRELLYPRSDDHETARRSLQDTFYTQPSIFVVEYALARLWQSLGVQPAVMVGHSIGEFVAATLADVWDLEDALTIIALRGRLMQDLPRGSMLAVNLGAEAVERLLPATVQIASINSPGLCVVAGPEADIQGLKVLLEERGIVCRALHTSHAFHSAMMDPMLDPLRAAVARVQLRPPARPIVSTVTGELMTAANATDPSYWARHARATVMFSKAVQWLLAQRHDLFLECGPRSTLSSLVRQHFAADRHAAAIPTLPDAPGDNAEWAALLFALGSLWQHGVTIDWEAFGVHEDRRRVPLPTYAFERQRYWVDPAPTGAAAAPGNAGLGEGDADAHGQPPLPQASPADGPMARMTARLLDVLAPISGHEPADFSTSATFLEQGFNSLSLTQVALGIQREFGVKVTFAQLMDQLHNVEKVVAFLDEAASGELAGGSTTASPALHSSASTTAADEACDLDLPTTAGQREIWFASKLGATRAYNQLVDVRLRGPLDRAALQASVQELVDRNGALRTTISADGRRQLVSRRRTQELTVVDLSTLSLPQQAARLESLNDERRTTPFKLAEGPLMRAQLVCLNAQDHVLQLAFHHVVVDGWSTHVVATELGRLYSAHVSGERHARPPAMQFQDYVAWYESAGTRKARQDAQRYWVAAFSDLPASVALPCKGPRPAQRSYRAGTVEFAIDRELCARIRKASAASDASLFHVLLASFVAWLRGATGQHDVVVGVPVAGQLAMALQHIDGCERLIGHASAVVPIRARVEDAAPFTGLIGDVKRTLLAARAHEGYTSGELIEALEPARDPGRLPIVSVILNLNDEPAAHWDGLAAELHVPPRSSIFFDLEINMWEGDAGLAMACYFAQDLFDAETVTQWLAQWRRMLIDAAAHPERPLEQLGHFGACRAGAFKRDRIDDLDIVASGVPDRPGEGPNT